MLCEILESFRLTDNTNIFNFLYTQRYDFTLSNVSHFEIVGHCQTFLISRSWVIVKRFSFRDRGSLSNVSHFEIVGHCQTFLISRSWVIV